MSGFRIRFAPAAGTFIVVLAVLLGLDWLIAYNRFQKGLPEASASEVSAALEKACAASKDGNPNGVLELLLKSFQFNGQKADRSSIALAVRKLQPEVTLKNEKISIFGNQAIATADVSMTSASTSTQALNVPGVQMVLVRTLGTGHLIFPALDWQLKSADASSQIPMSAFDSLTP